METIANNNALKSRFIKKWSLAHGGEYEIRPMAINDREAVLDLFQHLSTQSRYFRYAHAMSTLPEQLLEQIISANQPDDFALGAYIKNAESSKWSLVGISRYVRHLVYSLPTYDAAC